MVTEGICSHDINKKSDVRDRVKMYLQNATGRSCCRPGELWEEKIW